MKKIPDLGSLYALICTCRGFSMSSRENPHKFSRKSSRIRLLDESQLDESKDLDLSNAGRKFYERYRGFGVLSTRRLSSHDCQDFLPFARLGLAIWDTKRLSHLGLVGLPPPHFENMRVPPATGSENPRYLGAPGLVHSQVCHGGVIREPERIAMTTGVAHPLSEECEELLKFMEGAARLDVCGTTPHYLAGT